ncbi:prepilin-type N-terminal cleavage/methylation domain-containing protein [Planomonospora sp. ID91781]|uniref:type II secretion system protein n=1 Tax=Planomonospora sp. ID91781 TaxID=2738135 RepID=UPI0018C3CA11|nr:prepilin-type N-terminal cleavage/methylation domain-containing protein [Planomonospora sp. ID91781]MBG0821117.1 prepilin-type N-terminal cleavage/methylation domain-containing protein [Planomonospora sp. ID91781]
MKATLRRLQTRAHGDRGFTLIELLVVVVIIGVLVAIAIPVYMNYREGAADKSAQSDVRGAITAVENYYTTNSNVYPTTATPDATTNATKVTLSGATGTTAQVVTVSAGTTLKYKEVGTGYVICAMNSGGTKNTVYEYKSANGGSVKKSAQTTVDACIGS